jgi:hypothetical protein
VHAALFRNDRRPWRCCANTFEDQLFALTIGFGNEIAATRLLFIMKTRLKSREEQLAGLAGTVDR